MEFTMTDTTTTETAAQAESAPADMSAMVAQYRQDAIARASGIEVAPVAAPEQKDTHTQGADELNEGEAQHQDDGDGDTGDADDGDDEFGDDAGNKRDPFQRIKHAGKKHREEARSAKRERDEARQENAILRHELSKYKEALDEKLFGADKPKEPEKKEYLDEDLAADTEVKLTEHQKEIFETKYLTSEMRGIIALDNPKDFDNAQRSFVLAVMIDDLNKINLQNGSNYGLKDLDENDFDKLADLAHNQVEALKRQQYLAGKNPVHYVVNTASKLGLLKPVEKHQKPASIDLDALDSARRSTGKAAISRESVKEMGVEDYRAAYLKRNSVSG
jgi:hypothetical protein